MVQFLKPQPTDNRMARLAWWIASRFPAVSIGRLRKAEEHAEWATAQMVRARLEAEFFRRSFDAVRKDVAKLTRADKWSIPDPKVSAFLSPEHRFSRTRVRIDVPPSQFEIGHADWRKRAVKISHETEAVIFDLAYGAADMIARDYAAQIAAEAIKAIEAQHV